MFMRIGIGLSGYCGVSEQSWDRLVFLGDYFDSFEKPPRVTEVGHLCDKMISLREEFGDRVIFLLGNHDIHYLETKHLITRGQEFPLQLAYQCSGYEMDKAKTITEKLDWTFGETAGCLSPQMAIC